MVILYRDGSLACEEIKSLLKARNVCFLEERRQEVFDERGIKHLPVVEGGTFSLDYTKAKEWLLRK